jgi:hypothetical protein
LFLHGDIPREKGSPVDTAKTYSELVRESLAGLRKETGLNWQHETTGGGFDGFMYVPSANEPDSYWFVTIGDDACAPTSEDEWKDIALGYYSDALEGDGFIMIPDVSTFEDLVRFFAERKPR